MHSRNAAQYSFPEHGTRWCPSYHRTKPSLAKSVIVVVADMHALICAAKCICTLPQQSAAAQNLKFQILTISTMGKKILDMREVLSVSDRFCPAPTLPVCLFSNGIDFRF